MDDFELEFGDFVPDSAGIRELFTSDGMRSVLMEAATAKAAEANSIAKTSTRWGLYHDPYGADTKVVGGNTAIGRVNTKSKQAAYLDNKHKILNSINH